MYITIALSSLFILSFYCYLRVHKQYSDVKRLSGDIDKKYYPATVEEKKLAELSKKYNDLQSTYQGNLALLKKNEARLSHYHLGVGTSDTASYRRLLDTNNLDVIECKLATIKATLQELVKNKSACVCNMGSDFVVNGKKSEARKLLNREIKLRLRCLDNEFKGAAALADWNNIERLIQRTKDTFNEINYSGNMVKTYLKDTYLNLKLDELRLGYEITQLKSDLIEEARENARIEREAERENIRIIVAAEKAVKERIMMEKLVAEELSKLESSSEEQKALYELHKQELDILKNKERQSMSLAQQTRAGFVYVISNELSFGAGICKIGMTRRVDPNERVKELGDASVPELFTVHAFAFTDDAPQLENYLHNQFAKSRVNLVNKRKEFFHVSPYDVMQQLKTYGGSYELSDLMTATVS